MKKILNKIFGSKNAKTTGDQTPTPVDSASVLWDAVYQSRQTFFETNVGLFPDQVMKVQDLIGVWPGGCLIDTPADKIGTGLHAYASFGLTNPDLPNGIKSTATSVTSKAGRTVTTTGVLHSSGEGIASGAKPSTGHGYEIMVLTKEDTVWPKYFLQWLVKMELMENLELLDRVNEFGGMTLESVGITETESMSMLIAKAAKPIQAHLPLPTGDADLLIGTIITKDELAWSLEKGPASLLANLVSSHDGQVSDPLRQSVSLVD